MTSEVEKKLEELTEKCFLIDLYDKNKYYDWVVLEFILTKKQFDFYTSTKTKKEKEKEIIEEVNKIAKIIQKTTIVLTFYCLS